jgi:hypothetical protein
LEDCGAVLFIGPLEVNSPFDHLANLIKLIRPDIIEQLGIMLAPVENSETAIYLAYNGQTLTFANLTNFFENT